VAACLADIRLACVGVGKDTDFMVSALTLETVHKLPADESSYDGSKQR
jgi:hypothetical protein